MQLYQAAPFLVLKSSECNFTCDLINLLFMVASFSVPCGLSMKRHEEPWAKSFIARMNEKLRRCSQVWTSVRLEVEFFRSQSQVIVL